MTNQYLTVKFLLKKFGIKVYEKDHSPKSYNINPYVPLVNSIIVKDFYKLNKLSEHTFRSVTIIGREVINN